jgi:hypothetical protein
MTTDDAKALLEPMEPDTKLVVARVVRESAADVVGDAPDHTFAADVRDAAERTIRGWPHAEDWEMVLDAYVEIVLADATTPEELLNEHRKIVTAYTE